MLLHLLHQYYFDIGTLVVLISLFAARQRRKESKE